VKIAVAFFGLPRCSEVTFPSIKQQIFAHLPTNAEVRFFFHFYFQNEVINTHSNESGVLAASNYSPFQSFEGVLERPEDVFQELNVEEFKKFGNAWPIDDHFMSLRNLLLQLRSLKKVTELVENFGPDCVLFARPDLFYHDPIPSYYYDASMTYKNAIFVPPWQWGIGLNDRFCLAGKNAYKAYGNRVDEALNYCMEGKRPLHSERLLKYAITKQKKEVYIINTKASRVRINGEFVKEKFGTNISFFSPISNPHKRFLFLSKVKTRFKLMAFKK
jgi:hypothetical protein